MSQQPRHQTPLVNGLHLEVTNICTLKCPGCARTRFINAWPQHWKNHSIDADRLLNFLDIDLTGLPIHLCGNSGDPIYHPELIELVRKLKARGAVIKLTTNGSYKKVDWWEELTSVLTASDTVVFSIDGSPENFTDYRINADWPSIEAAIKVCVNASPKTVWKYIVFKYNQDCIEDVRELATQLGIDAFNISLSDRFDDHTNHLIPDKKFVGLRYEPQEAWKSSKSNCSVDPKCKTGEDHYISADGYYIPCCYVGDYRFYYKTLFGKQKQTFNINNTTLSTLLNNPELTQFFNTLESHVPCQYNCPNTTPKN